MGYHSLMLQSCGINACPLTNALQTNANPAIAEHGLCIFHLDVAIVVHEIRRVHVDE